MGDNDIADGPGGSLHHPVFIMQEQVKELVKSLPGITGPIDDFCTISL
jgi:hypothetical protein